MSNHGGPDDVMAQQGHLVPAEREREVWAPDIAYALAARNAKGVSLMESQDTFVATAGTLSPGAHPGGFNGQDAYTDHPVPQSVAVRRLLPVECERLQAFPDGWTIPAGADGPRYRCLGNAVTSSVAFWIGERMRRVHEGEEVNRPVDVAGYIERLNA